MTAKTREFRMVGDNAVILIRVNSVIGFECAALSIKFLPDWSIIESLAHFTYRYETAIELNWL